MVIASGGGAGDGPCVLVHGGAGSVPEARRADHVAGCEAAARAGLQVLEAGGSALDAVQAAVRVLEDLPQFNAGTGAALNSEGEVAHDASMMRGSDLAAGAVGALMAFKNPIDVARAVLDDGRHVLMVGDGARAFANARGIPAVEPSSLVTAQARAALETFREGGPSGGTSGWAGGTVGAVAIDAERRTAAATSTGGTLAKRVGRLGDSPIVGAGTYADDRAGAASATGDGEGILRLSLTVRTALRMVDGASPREAARASIAELLERTGARGGLIVVDPLGRFGWARSTSTMTFALARPSGVMSGIDDGSGM